MNWKKTIMWCLIILLGAACLFFALDVMKLAPLVQQEMRSTATPTPLYGNVLIVTPDPSAPTAPPLLKKGFEGEAVSQMQERLQTLGYYSGTIDGQFGGGTVNAVTLFQQQNGLDADGIAGPATLSALYASDAKPFTATPTPMPTDVPLMTPEPIHQAANKPYIRPDGLPMLVNKIHALPDGYEPYELVNMKNYCDPSIVKIKYSNTTAEREAVDALMLMLQDGINAGIRPWQISAAYRDVAYQQTLFDNQVKTYMKENNLSREKAISATKKTVAVPGESEHHLGLAFDITVPGTTFAGTDQASWLEKNCWDYGFILRYTKEKQAITGYLAEAWHFRYVGQPHARIMRDENLCLEEYLAQYGSGEEIEEWID